MVSLDFGITESIATKIRNYGTAVTVGVFIGTALTTGIVAGCAAWYASNKVAIVSEATRFLNVVSGDKTSDKDTDERIVVLAKRVDMLEANLRDITSGHHRT